MEKLIEGHRRFLADAFPARRDQFHLLAERQAPETLFITCADSRIVPDLILQTQPGDLFICRNAGNVIPRAGEPAGGVSATIEYAVEVLRVRHLIVCGHSDCGVIRALMAPQAFAGLTSVYGWLQHVEPAWEYVGEVERNAEELTRHTALTHANVLVQLDNLRDALVYSARHRRKEDADSRLVLRHFERADRAIRRGVGEVCRTGGVNRIGTGRLSGESWPILDQRRNEATLLLGIRGSAQVSGGVRTSRG